MCVEINEATMDFSTAHGVTQNLEKENCKQSKRQDGNIGDADKNVCSHNDDELGTFCTYDLQLFQRSVQITRLALHVYIMYIKCEQTPRCYTHCV
jgi:hypothetical protein